MWSMQTVGVVQVVDGRRWLRMVVDIRTLSPSSLQHSRIVDQGGASDCIERARDRLSTRDLYLNNLALSRRRLGL